MLKERGKFEGMLNVIRFNWPFFAFAIALTVFILLCGWYFPFNLGLQAVFIGFVWCGVTLSLVISHWVYDRSDLYRFGWLRLNKNPQSILTINAGFDETSALIKRKIPSAEVLIADIYNEEIHSEPSIRRAQKRYPRSPKTIHVDASQLPFETEQFDVVFAILVLHEIRDRQKRIEALVQLRKVLKKEGVLIITEHLRDMPNFLAYSIGFFHFYSQQTWLRDFKSANLVVKEELKITPFVSSFILTHGNPS